MYVALRFIGLLFAIGAIIMLFATFFVPEKGLHEKHGPRDRAIWTAAVFGFSALVCYVLSFLVGV